MPSIKSIMVEIGDGGERVVTVSKSFTRSEALEPDDVANIMDAIDEIAGADVTGKAEPKTKPAPKRRRGRPAGSRNKSKPDPAPETSDEEEEEETPEPPKKRRRKPASTTYPPAEDAALCAAALAEVFGADDVADIVGMYSDDGTVEGIPEERRREFMDAAEAELNDVD